MAWKLWQVDFSGGKTLENVIGFVADAESVRLQTLQAIKDKLEKDDEEAVGLDVQTDMTEHDLKLVDIPQQTFSPKGYIIYLYLHVIWNQWKVN